MFLLVSTFTLAQSTVGTGSVQGTVTDQSGAVVANARVTITNKATAGALHLTASSAGTYSSGPIQPGDYVVRAEAKGFKTVEEPVTVQVGNTATVSPKLAVGLESQVIEVQGAVVGVNTEQATVQGTIGLEQIENLPVNGRNFLDLALSSRAFRFKRAALSIPPRTVSPRSLSRAGSAARQELRWMVSTSATKP